MKADEKTFEAIVREYSRPLYWHIRRMVVDHDDASDVLQETFVRAYRYLWTVRDQEKLGVWLYRIATNEANRFLRSLKKGVELGDYLVQKLEASEHVDFTKDAEIKMQKALLTLTPQQRTVFNLKYYDDMDYPQIAKITGSREQTLRVAYHYAMEKVKKYILEK